MAAGKDQGQPQQGSTPGKASMLGNKMRAVSDVLGLVRPWQCALVIGGLFLSSLFDLFGLTMIVPLLASVTSFGQGKLGLVTALREAIEGSGLPFHPATFLTLIVVGLTLKAVTALAVMRYVGNLVATIGRTMQLRVIHSLMQARWGFFIHQPLGRLGSAAGSEAAAAGECFLSLTTLIAAGLQTLLFLAIAAIISIELAAVTLVVTVLMLASFGRLVQQIGRPTVLSVARFAAWGRGSSMPSRASSRCGPWDAPTTSTRCSRRTPGLWRMRCAPVS